MKPVSVTIRWSDGSLTHDIYDGESYYRNPAASEPTSPLVLHGIKRWLYKLRKATGDIFIIPNLSQKVQQQSPRRGGAVDALMSLSAKDER
jgi:hypothetical protein